MNLSIKARIKSYSFWVSLASAILLLVQAVGKPLGLVINEEIYMSIVNSVLGVFVVLGIISHPAQNLVCDKIEEIKEQDENLELSKNINNTSSINNKSDSADGEINDNTTKDNDVKTLEQIKQNILRDCKERENSQKN